METQADIPPDLTDDDKAFFLQALDVELNSGIFYALLYGVYTGILAVTLWNIFINKIRPVRRALVVIIILLHALITINFAADWSYTRSAFIENGQSFWTVYLNLNVTEASYWEMDIPALMSTILTDSYMIWCCWVVWGRRWLIVLLPIICLITATVSKVLQVYLVNSNAYMSYEVFLMLYISFILATTLWCTLLIIFRILTVTGVGRGAGGRLFLILYLALFIRNDFGFYYLDAIASIAKGVAPTLLVGRAAAGHTRPTEEHDETSVVSTIRFQTSAQSSHPSQPSTSSYQESTMQSAVLEVDLEAQLEQSDEFVVSVVNTQ
ncbi:uncharacterized protein EV420DRAFT_1642723 [Desarmillaria tabescens]|uniref:Uncharacterized protein n=1 Tax=Armillaria tabescens TaxID=1929756 RepID=A0AA39KFX3_ARMTA|nr:uncharacterized protein EV420DRAFT_1642723 [Desarmillaria tabescens]KAK0459024.1 hypothetical protein EV420DRAFT_1642723 [Desarmillaria tabescens]